MNDLIIIKQNRGRCVRLLAQQQLDSERINELNNILTKDIDREKRLKAQKLKDDIIERMQDRMNKIENLRNSFEDELGVIDESEVNNLILTGALVSAAGRKKRRKLTAQAQKELKAKLASNRKQWLKLLKRRRKNWTKKGYPKKKRQRLTKKWKIQYKISRNNIMSRYGQKVRDIKRKTSAKGIIKGVGRDVTSKIKQAGKFIAETAKKAVNKLKEGLFTPLLPFKRPMQRALRKEGVAHPPGNMEKLSKMFYSRVVKKSSFDESEENNVVASAVSGIVQGILEFFKSSKEKAKTNTGTKTERDIGKQVAAIEDKITKKAIKKAQAEGKAISTPVLYIGGFVILVLILSFFVFSSKSKK